MLQRRATHATMAEMDATQTAPLATPQAEASAAPAAVAPVLDAPPAAVAAPSAPDMSAFVPRDEFLALQAKFDSLPVPEPVASPVDTGYTSQSMAYAQKKLGPSAPREFVEKFSQAERNLHVLDAQYNRAEPGERPAILTRIREWQHEKAAAEQGAWVAKYRTAELAKTNASKLGDDAPDAPRAPSESASSTQQIERFRSAGPADTELIRKHLPNVAAQFDSGTLDWARDIAEGLDPDVDINRQVEWKFNQLDRMFPGTDAAAAPEQVIPLPGNPSSGAPSGGQVSGSTLAPPKTMEEHARRDRAVLVQLHGR